MPGPLPKKSGALAMSHALHLLVYSIIYLCYMHILLSVGQQQDQDDHQHLHVPLVQVPQDLQEALHHPQVQKVSAL